MNVSQLAWLCTWSCVSICILGALSACSDLEPPHASSFDASTGGHDASTSPPRDAARPDYDGAAPTLDAARPGHDGDIDEPDACAHCTPSDASTPSDAGLDASHELDASLDAGVDTSTDAGLDATLDEPDAQVPSTVHPRVTAVAVGYETSSSDYVAALNADYVTAVGKKFRLSKIWTKEPKSLDASGVDDSMSFAALDARIAEASMAKKKFILRIAIGRPELPSWLDCGVAAPGPSCKITSADDVTLVPSDVNDGAASMVVPWSATLIKYRNLFIAALGRHLAGQADMLENVQITGLGAITEMNLPDDSKLLVKGSSFQAPPTLSDTVTVTPANGGAFAITKATDFYYTVTELINGGGEGPAQDKPAHAIVNDTADTVTITFTPSGLPNVTGYRVYRTTVSNGVGSALHRNNGQIVMLPASATSFTDRGNATGAETPHDTLNQYATWLDYTPAYGDLPANTRAAFETRMLDEYKKLVAVWQAAFPNTQLALSEDEPVAGYKIRGNGLDDQLVLDWLRRNHPEVWVQNNFLRGPSSAGVDPRLLIAQQYLYSQGGYQPSGVLSLHADAVANMQAICQHVLDDRASYLEVFATDIEPGTFDGILTTLTQSTWNR